MSSLAQQERRLYNAYLTTCPTSKRNVVVSGIPETGSIGNDRIEFLRICATNMSIKLAIGEDSCRQLGKELTSGGRLDS